jgi:hypothetical protein
MFKCTNCPHEQEAGEFCEVCGDYTKEVEVKKEPVVVEERPQEEKKVEEILKPKKTYARRKRAN